MIITSRTVSFDNTVIQTSNISEASTYKKVPKGRIAGFIFGVLAILFGGALVVEPGAGGYGFAILAFGLFLFVSAIFRRTRFELHLQTNAGKVTAISSSDRKFIHDVVEKIREAMTHQQSNVAYTVNVDNKTINEGNRTTIDGSANVNVVGGDASNVNQSNVSNGLSDVSELIALVDTSDAGNKDELKALLEDVRIHLAGGETSREQASASWRTFAAQVGAIALTGGNVWGDRKSVV